MEIHPTPVPQIGPHQSRRDPVRWLQRKGIEQFAERWRPTEELRVA
jgi:hypothetical protein